MVPNCDSEELGWKTNDLNGRKSIKVYLRHDNSHIKFFQREFQNRLFQPQSFSFPPQHQNFWSQIFENQNSWRYKSNFQPKASFEVFTPETDYLYYTQQTQNSCHKWGYPNHLLTIRTVRGNYRRRGAQIQIFTPDFNYVTCTQQTQIINRKCRYNNHLVTNCTVQRNFPLCGD